MQEPPEAMIEPSTRTMLAYERTRIASERTLMAWTRTAVSLVGFGFSIPKFFRFLAEAHPQARPMIAPDNLGLMLIALGTLSLSAGMLQHVLLLRRLESHAHALHPLHPFRSVALSTAACMVLFGFYAFENVLVRR
jgi:putative membrane protein